MRRRFGKIGLLMVTLVVAIGVMGAAFASWTDSVSISGEVDTGNLDLNVVDYSGTWVWKVPEHEIVTWSGWVGDLADNTPGDGMLVASSVAGPMMDGNVQVDDAIWVDYDNLFPCIDFKVDFLLKYEGSVPARLVINDPEFTGENAAFFNALVWSLPNPGVPDGGSYLYGEMWTSNADGEKLVNITSDEMYGYQVHEGDYIIMVFTLHLAQDNTLMDMDADFTAGITAVQWNEYDEFV